MRASDPACHSPPSQLAQLRPQWTWPLSQDPDSFRWTQILGASDWEARELVSSAQTAPAYHAPTPGRVSYDHILQPPSSLCGPHCPPGLSGLFRDGRTCSPRETGQFINDGRTGDSPRKTRDFDSFSSTLIDLVYFIFL